MPDLTSFEAAERDARTALDDAQDAMDAGRVTPAAFAETYEAWLAASNALKRARRESEGQLRASALTARLPQYRQRRARDTPPCSADRTSGPRSRAG